MQCIIYVSFNLLLISYKSGTKYSYIYHLSIDPFSWSNSEYIGKTSLMYAAENRHLEVVKILLEHGANIEAKKDDG